MNQNADNGATQPVLMRSPGDSGTCFNSEDQRTRPNFQNILKTAGGLPQPIMSTVTPIVLAFHDLISEIKMYHAH